MTNPTEFKPIKDLRQIDDQGISGDLLLLIEGKQEALNATLSQLASFIIKPLLDNIYPPGVPIPWPRDTAPTGYALINNGLNFDTATYPQLAVAWPGGVIPPHKGRVIECTAQGASVADLEQGEIKSHGHNSSISDYDYGTKQTSDINAFPDSKEAVLRNPNDLERAQSSSPGDSTTTGLGSNSPDTAAKAIHKHNTVIGKHGHTSTIDDTGGARNTVDRINYNYMVRLA